MSAVPAVATLFASLDRYLADHEPWPEATVARSLLREPVPSLVTPPPDPIPLSTHWSALQDAALPRSTTTALRDAVIDAAPFLHWRQNQTYRDRAFLTRYAYSELIGPAGLLPSAQVSVGFLLLAAGTLYPDHAHPAEEVYHVVAGAARWRAGPAGWAEQPAGARILHPSGVPHAMQTGETPLLALYLWRGELATPATWHGVAP